jgi:hypothetical protein
LPSHDCLPVLFIVRLIADHPRTIKQKQALSPQDSQMPAPTAGGLYKGNPNNGGMVL